MQDENRTKVDIIDLDVIYNIRSPLGPMENDRFKQDIVGEIVQVDELETKIANIGKVNACKLLIDVGLQNGWDTFSICDVEQLSMDVGQIVYDFKENEWNKTLEKYFDLISR